jgi:hypothetical protein
MTIRMMLPVAPEIDGEKIPLLPVFAELLSRVEVVFSHLSPIGNRHPQDW